VQRKDPGLRNHVEGGKSMNEPLTIYLQDHLAGGHGSNRVPFSRILGKLALWRALETLFLSDTRLSGVPFDELVLRAKTQFFQVEDSGKVIYHTRWLHDRGRCEQWQASLAYSSS
jgi:hypothetical protein